MLCTDYTLRSALYITSYFVSSTFYTLCWTHECMFSYQSLSVCKVSLPTSVYEILVVTVFCLQTVVNIFDGVITWANLIVATSNILLYAELSPLCNPLWEGWLLFTHKMQCAHTFQHMVPCWAFKAYVLVKFQVHKVLEILRETWKRHFDYLNETVFLQIHNICSFRVLIICWCSILLL